MGDERTAESKQQTPTGAPPLRGREAVLSDFRKIVGDRRPDRGRDGSPNPPDASADPLRSPREATDA
jgi:hypothetical protein